MTASPATDHRIAHLVDRERHRRRMTQREVAKAAGIAPNTVIRIERGERVRGSSLSAVLEVLEVNLDELEEREEQPSTDASTAADLVKEFVGDGADSGARLLHIARAIGPYR